MAGRWRFPHSSATFGWWDSGCISSFVSAHLRWNGVKVEDGQHLSIPLNPEEGLSGAPGTRRAEHAELMYRCVQDGEGGPQMGDGWSSRARRVSLAFFTGDSDFFRGTGVIISLSSVCASSKLAWFTELRPLLLCGWPQCSTAHQRNRACLAGVRERH